ncbi:MAG: hypothetical protein JO113_01835 [Candidatus Eremiobacteraeota bacterium]|nr:hypothetical protein [Candidatus Eremiobacteraeota bacterium]
MSKFFTVLALTVLGLAPGIALSQPMSVSMVGVGAHGYDFMIGSWSCTNSVPSRLGGPSTSSFTISRSANGALFVHSTAENYDTASYVVYAPKTKTWWSPTSYADGSYNFESTRQTGAKTVWTGTLFDASSGKTTSIRDTFEFPNATTQTDLTQVETAGTWKTVANSTCKKT